VENLSWGLSMTAVGMGLVFAMLALLWGLLTLVLRLDRPVAAATASQDTAAPASASPDAAPDDGIAPEVIVAITIATLAHVSARRREAAPLMRSYWPGSLLFASRWVATGRARQNRIWQRRGR
jgi:Na+-transporting methylmalonyl-CoA/oxaloacetate decarboxylase gamma subunit